ncbi:hypothetical protein DBR06_SOUSAS33710038, partial [Sousa chinensis]
TPDFPTIQTSPAASK